MADDSSESNNQPASNDEVDERFRALLEGLRTSLPGVQVLFAFLLTAPLQDGFADLTTHSRVAFTIAFFAAGSASVLLIAPSVHQRLRAPATGLRRQSASHLALTIRVTIVGTFVMGIAIVSTVYLVSSVILDVWFASAASVILTAVLAWSWFYLPYVRFPNDDG